MIKIECSLTKNEATDIFNLINNKINDLCNERNRLKEEMNPKNKVVIRALKIEILYWFSIKEKMLS